jgi:hypothetical protein
MGKTKRKQPEWLRDDDRWMRKGGSHKDRPSRKKQKQKLYDEVNKDVGDY